MVVHDCGTVINPLILAGQIHGGVAQGIGNAFYEQLVFDDQAQLLNASLADYLLPTALDVPRMELGHTVTPSPLNPLGIKGAGEAGAIPVGPLFAQAIEDALGLPARGHRVAGDPAQPKPAVGTGDEGEMRGFVPWLRFLALLPARSARRGGTWGTRGEPLGAHECGGQPIGLASCTIFASDKISGSSKRGATICKPTGRPSCVRPAGTLPAGRLTSVIRNAGAIQST